MQEPGNFERQTVIVQGPKRMSDRYEMSTPLAWTNILKTPSSRLLRDQLVWPSKQDL